MVPKNQTVGSFQPLFLAMLHFRVVKAVVTMCKSRTLMGVEGQDTLLGRMQAFSSAHFGGH